MSGTTAPAVLQCWAVRSQFEDPYLAPELNPMVLTGTSYADARRPDGHMVKTSPIVDVSGRLVTTRSGTVYRLGRIDPEYRRWLAQQGIKYDPREPVRRIGGLARRSKQDDDHEPRPTGCQCTWEAGDSPCPVHGLDEEREP